MDFNESDTTFPACDVNPWGDDDRTLIEERTGCGAACCAPAVAIPAFTASEAAWFQPAAQACMVRA